MSERRLRLGFLVNPYAGAGGASAYKGSDGDALRALVDEGKIKPVAGARAQQFLDALTERVSAPFGLEFVTVEGHMGGQLTQATQYKTHVVDLDIPAQSTSEHTRMAVNRIQEAGVDLLIFVGGDGTARDVCAAVQPGQLVLGVPSGVKMHSSVFAVTPSAAAELVSKWLAGDLIDKHRQEVRDIDEQAFRQGRVSSRFYGEMMTPELGQFMQHVKQGGFEVEELVLLDLAEDIRETLPEDALIVLGPGSTTFHIAKNWGIEATLLGVDLVSNCQLLAADVDAASIEQYAAAHKGGVYVVVTAIGGQGHVFGRGNQQISAALLRNVGLDHVIVVATKTKLKSLEGRPLLMDSGDAELDRQWSGYVTVWCGYQHRVHYALS